MRIACTSFAIFLFFLLSDPLTHAESNNSKRNVYLRQAITLAQSARDHGNHPFGALLVHNDEVILTSENEVMTSKDFTAHAELQLVKKAALMFDKETLKNSTLYTSTEPCAMCAGAIVWSGIKDVVYGSPTEILAKHSNGSFLVPCRTIFEKSNKEITCEGPCLETEAEKVHIGFWKPKS